MDFLTIREHFEFGPRIIGRTPIGRVTVQVLAMNADDLLLIRVELLQGRRPLRSQRLAVALMRRPPPLFELTPQANWDPSCQSFNRSSVSVMLGSELAVPYYLISDQFGFSALSDMA
jgi:hypothetical protein